ncbi:GntR family transcriptional regulator [Pseudonocardia yuanmonensis]|uniref:GntR family transcriptional regulator n=1 Tax=Pseudonocardia yuanmonensis TaxID=1095914 RepID=A0ABP8XRJ9_9PSEU
MAAADPAPGLSLIQTSSLVDEAYRQIRGLILEGQLKPGTRLKDSVLADEMGISRSPVREALRLLEHSGLVEKSVNRSYRISVLDPGDVPELARLRCADEVMAVRTIVQRGTPVESLAKWIEELRRVDGDPEAGAAADAAFHSEVVRLAGMPRLDLRYSGLTDQMRLVLLTGDVSWGSGGVLVDSHTVLYEALVDAVRTGDPREAMRLWEFHILTGMGVPDILEPL